MGWSHKVPVVPVKGDATETYKLRASLTDGPLSFVWLDLDMDVLTRLGQPDGISPSRMAEMLEVDKAGLIVRC